MFYLIIQLALFVTLCHACAFPPNWRDSWMTSGFGVNVRLSISQSSMTSKGRCIMSIESTNKYLLAQQSNEDGRDVVCYRCLVFSPRHVNVIQFKEAIQCDPPNTDNGLLDRVCSLVGADSTLHTLVREFPVPISCPVFLREPLTFTYDKGNGYCDKPSKVSSVRSCASTKRLQMTFEECDDLRDYGYTREETEVQCLATWKSSGNWLYVKYGEDDYRCINYDETSKVLGMTQDASCTGIAVIYSSPIVIEWNTEVDSTVKSEARCSYPSWFTQNDWSDMKVEYNYRYDLVTRELVVDKQIHYPISYTETSQRHVCYMKISESADEVKYITESTNECSHGYQCVIFRKKSDSVVELQTGAVTDEPSDACTMNSPNSPSSEKRLLININSPPITCPLSGKFTIRSSTTSCPVYMEMGCSGSSAISVKECDMLKAELSCLASWRDQGESRIIISKSTYPRVGNCYTYRIEEEDVVLSLSEGCNLDAPSILDSSLPQPPFRLPPAENKCIGSVDVLHIPSIKDSRKDVEDEDNSSYRMCYGVWCLVVTFLACLHTLQH